LDYKIWRSYEAISDGINPIHFLVPIQPPIAEKVELKTQKRSRTTFSAENLDLLLV
jgi:hypothetical protein